MHQTDLKLTAEQVALHDRLYAQAWTLIKSEIHVRSRVQLDKLDWRTRQKLNEAISLFQQTLELHPRNWNSMWALGKIYQRLNDHSTALTWFRRANKIEPHNADILREASLCAMKLGDAGAAVELAAAAIELRPDDVGLISNLALALLIDGRTESAREQAVNAVQIGRDATVARSVLRLIEDVSAGRLPRPRTIP